MVRGHRGLCRVIDYAIDRESYRDLTEVYMVTQAYNANLHELYLTQRNEKMEFSEEQLVDIAY